ncbi:MAG: T9SS type A sorting domain-containing protein [Candidatus Marinimicrobia bacterium]|nr:T9SS type A sorting domain-containing protein [Candidatus Neomarinimicrobiota bacterium]MBT7972837.1 T9SS type A sorting domain-containing protein [Candidatus Neomarinimicrobiota bacterium]
MKKIAILLSLIVSANAQYLEFDGTNDYIEATDNSFPMGSEVRTAAMWIKTTQTGEKYFFCYGKDDTQYQRWSIGISNGYNLVEFNNASVHSEKIVNDGLWHHIAASYDGTNMNIYVDGSKESLSGDINVTFDTKSSGKVLIGDNSDTSVPAGSYRFKGSIDEVSVFNKALSADEILELYKSGSELNLISNSGDYVSSSNLVGYWRFNEGTGTTVGDASSKGNDGTIYGANWIDGESSFNDKGTKAITFNVELPTHSLPDTNISLVFWKSGAESNECTGCNGRDTVSMRKLSDDHWEATVGLDTTLVAGDVGESMYWYHYFKTIPDYTIKEDLERFKSEPNPDGLRQLEPGWHKETPLVNKDTVIAWNNIAPESFEWISDVLDTVIINKDNITDTYNLQWAESKSVDLDSIHYLVYAKIGVYPVEEIYDTTVTTLPLTYQEFLENVFEETPGNGVTVKFSVSATDGKDTVKVSGDDRVVYVNRYEYLSTESEGIPTVFALHENYPNPFNPTTTLRFDLPEVSDITLTIYNMLGQRVKTFNMNDTPAGFHSIKWNAINDYGDPVGAGVYLYQLRANQYLETRKMVLLK